MNYMREIPKIIHQIWSGIYEPLPNHFRKFSDTWREYHPEWAYELWDHHRMNNFVCDNYPQYWDTYQSFQFNIQRWDVVRYLILNKIGGMYVDFDYECLQPHDSLINGKTCCFSMEPEKHHFRFNKTVLFNNALMACIPDHPFMKKIIETVFCYVPRTGILSTDQHFLEVLATTGPLALTEIYEKYPDKEQVFLIPAQQVSPFDIPQLRLIRNGYESEELDCKLEGAFSVHYFFSEWIK